MSRIFSVLELSTAHLTPDVGRSLDMVVNASPLLASVFDADRDWRYWVVVERWSEYGWWVWSGQDDGIHLLPPDLRACFVYARLNGCDWIRFDRDEEATPDLPQHDW